MPIDGPSGCPPRPETPGTRRKVPAVDDAVAGVVAAAMESGSRRKHIIPNIARA